MLTAELTLTVCAWWLLLWQQVDLAETHILHNSFFRPPCMCTACITLFFPCL